MLHTVLTIFYVLICLFLIVVVLLQSGRGGGLGGGLGGAGQQVFGGAGAGNLLTRLTTIFALTFMVLSATLSYLSSSHEEALERAAKKVAEQKAAQEAEAAKKAAAVPSPASGSAPVEAEPVDENMSTDATAPTAPAPARR